MLIDSVKTFLFVGSMLTGAFLLFLGVFVGICWERGNDKISAPRAVIPGYIEDFDRFCARTDWCVGHLGHTGACFTSDEGERPPGT